MNLFTTKTTKNANILKLLTVGISLLITALWMLAYDPLKMIVDTQLSLKAGTLLYNLWLKPPLEVFITVYMFNVTNLQAFISGIDLKLKVTEVGPYVYQEILENHNVTFNANDTITFNPRRTVKFIRERSVGDPKVDRIVAPNIPYMGVSSAASSFSGFAALAISVLTRKLNTKAMLDVTVHDYLWGYEDRLVQIASKFVPSIINFQSFGLLERMFDEGFNLVTMQLPVADKRLKPNKTQVARPYAIENWNGRDGIKFWNHDKKPTNCSSISGTYDGTLFPRNISKGETFRVYRKAFCRTMPITYSHPSVFDGIEGYNFKLPENAFDSDLNDPDTACFCKGQKCLKKGLGNITPCYYNIPLAISFPHFLNADPSLLKAIEGLKPNESKHGTEIVIQPQLGIPMKVHTRFQINLLMGEIKFNQNMERFQNTVLPIFWLDLGVDNLPPSLTMLLKLLFKVGPYLQLGIIITLAIIGISLLGTALLFRFWFPQHAAHHKLESKDTQKLSHFCVLPLMTRITTTTTTNELTNSQQRQQEDTVKLLNAKTKTKIPVMQRV